MSSRNSRTIVIGVSAFVAFMLVVTVTFVLVQSSGTGRFKAHIDEYLAINKEQPEQGAYLKGKMVVISKKEKEVDSEVLSGLRPELQSASPADVGTIVILNWSGDVRGTCPATSTFSTRLKCDAVVIVRSPGRLIGRKNFYAADPPALVAQGFRGH